MVSQQFISEPMSTTVVAKANRRYVNDMIQYIKGKGYTPRIWGSLTCKTWYNAS